MQNIMYAYTIHFQKVLYSLLMYSVVLLLMSCGKEQPEETATYNSDEVIVTSDMLRQGMFIKPPKDYEAKPHQELASYISELTPSNHKQLSENFRVSDYLLTVGLINKVEENMKYGELISEMDLTGILTLDQLKELADHELSPATARSCLFRWVNCYHNFELWHPTPYKRMFKLECNGEFHGYFIHLSEIIC